MILTHSSQSIHSFTEKEYNFLFNVAVLKEGIRRKINGNLNSVPDVYRALCDLCVEI
jgi:hypothetical protein